MPLSSGSLPQLSCPVSPLCSVFPPSRNCVPFKHMQSGILTQWMLKKSFLLDRGTVASVAGQECQVRHFSWSMIGDEVAGAKLNLRRWGFNFECVGSGKPVPQRQGHEESGSRSSCIELGETWGWR